MLEADVRQLPEQVVHEHETACVCRLCDLAFQPQDVIRRT
jgi:hypothetical protein